MPVPYGRTIPLKNPNKDRITPESVKSLIPYWENKRRDVLVSILMSHCSISRRMEYLKQLQEHMVVDIFGKCSKDHKDRYIIKLYFLIILLIILKLLYISL